MKKSRPGILLSVMCNEAKKDEMVSLIFKHTTTLGIRENVSKRYTLKREIVKKKKKGKKMKKKAITKVKKL